MNLKEVSELRRRFRMDRNAISRIYGCFVNSSREIVSYIDESMGILPQDEAEKYLNLLKKALSGKLGKNLIDIIFSTEQVADSDEHRLLMALRDSELKDGEIREEFYQKIINSLDLGDSNYLILLAYDTYDVPHKNKNDEIDADASDAVFSYVVCCVCPVKERKAELGFFPGDNEFHSCAGQIVAAPELGFLFPAFDDRAANIYNALFYSRKADEIHQEVEHMKEYVAIILTGCILFASVFVSANFELKEEEFAQTLSQQKATASEIYYVKNYKGYVSVFKKNEKSPMIKTDTLVSSLPYDDQDKLKEGIEVNGDTSLRKCLEDFCS